MANLFREVLEARLRRNSGPALRIALSPEPAEVQDFSGPALLDAARQLAQSRSNAAGRDVVLLLLPHSPELFLLHLGLVLDGKCPGILPWPTSRMDPEKYLRNLLHQIRDLPASEIITIPRIADLIRGGVPYAVTSCDTRQDSVSRAFAGDFRLALEAGPLSGTPPPLPDGALFLQFSGGTTGLQKCVVVEDHMLRHQLDRLADALAFGAGDSVVSWLPLYHDMGLIACLWLPLWFGAPSTHMAATDWLLFPEGLFGHVERSGGTLCWLPNFAFSYLAQRRPSMRGTYDLSRMKAWISCSEPVRARSMAEFHAAFADWGVVPEHLQASYAMAENVFAATQTPLDRSPRNVSRQSIAGFNPTGNLAFDLKDSEFVSSGVAIGGAEIRIAGSGSTLLPDGEAGEIQLRTDCQFRGYWSANGFDTGAFTGDGWYLTGDYGFLRDGELYVVGRIKDIIIVAGQNVFPEDIEAAVNGVDGVYPGRVVAFGIEDQAYGTQSIGIVAEMKAPFEEKATGDLAASIRRAVVSAVGIAPRVVHVVPERWIVKSTAGKISRRDTRDKFVRSQSTMEETSAQSQ